MVVALVVAVVAPQALGSLGVAQMMLMHVMGRRVAAHQPPRLRIAHSKHCTVGVHITVSYELYITVVDHSLLVF